MAGDEVAAVWVVAGCLFEVSLPAGGGRRWRWAGPAEEVTFLADDVRGRRHHFRFRAEAAGADADAVVLAFHRDDGDERSVHVRIAPEAALPP